jgi:hypothetical protein
VETPAASGSQPPPGLIELPATLENINAKMNHLIVRTEVAIKTSERAARIADDARSLSERAKSAAQASGTQALAITQHENLPRLQRALAIAMGAVVGGAAASFMVRVVVALGTAAGISSCAAVGL